MQQTIPPIWICAVMLLWSAPLLAWSAPRFVAAVDDIFRDRDITPYLFFLLATAAMFYAYPSSAEKGGGGETNNPPANASSPSGSIRLFYTDSNGHLVPLGAAIKGKP